MWFTPWACSGLCTFPMTSTYRMTQKQTEWVAASFMQDTLKLPNSCYRVRTTCQMHLEQDTCMSRGWTPPFSPCCINVILLIRSTLLDCQRTTLACTANTTTTTTTGKNIYNEGTQRPSRCCFACCHVAADTSVVMPGSRYPTRLTPTQTLYCPFLEVPFLDVV